MAYALAAVAAVVTVLLIIVISIDRRLMDERERVAAAARVEVEERVLRPPSTEGFVAYLSSRDVRATAVYKGSRYFATSGGLVALSADGNAEKRYTTFDGLPENELTGLAVFEDRLFIGTSSSGLVSFDGISFKLYRFTKPAAARISALLATDGELLIGTMEAGLLRFDGENFSRPFASNPDADLIRVTCLLSHESRLYIGTQDRGLYIRREGQLDRLTRQEGLPSDRVTGLVLMPPRLKGFGSTGVATDFGLIGLDADNHVRPISPTANVMSIANSDGRLWAGLFTGGILELTGDDVNREGPDPNRVAALGLPPASPVNLSASGSELWALTPTGAFWRDDSSSKTTFERVYPRAEASTGSIGGHVTTLALDSRGRLWVGYFDHGIDIVERETGNRITHLEDERVREINFIARDQGQDRMLVATSMGLAMVDGRFRQTILTREQGGIVNDSIAHVTVAEDLGSPSNPGASPRAGLVIATAGGLTELEGGRARSITAFHGLSSNHLYSSAVLGSRVFVGSLAGLVELEGLRVARAYRTSNSRLSHDWVTALAEVQGALFVGTNGGGIDELLPTGEWVNFADELGKFEVNQNAMYFDGIRLYVGTSNRGLLVYNTRDRTWTRISEGLTSQSVTAITSDDRFIFVGTTNGAVRIEKRILG